MIMLHMIHIILTLLVICLARPALGETFRWVDERGGVHFSDDFTKIPEKFQPGAVRVETEAQGRSRSTEEEKVRAGEGESKDQLGRGESYWRERVAETKAKLKSLQEKNENLRLRYNELTTRSNASRSSVERATIKNERDQVRQEMDKNKAEMEEARNALDKKIPEEAEFYKAKPEWIK